GRIATDALGEHMAAQDGLGQSVHTSDADYLAGLAELADPEPAAPVAAPAPVAAQIPAQQDPYGYQQPQQVDPYGYQQQPQVQQQPAALDETSFFDTSMIDLEQLRRYEQGQQ
ncbi:cell division initiation protein, partial [Streptomyces hydrogenans]